MAEFTKHTDDALLWNRFRSGDEHAYSELARRHYRTLVQYGRRFTPNMQVIEDTIQDVLVHLWLHRATINDTPSVKFYLIKSFRHRIIKTIKPLHDEIELTDQCHDRVLESSREELWIKGESDLALKKQVRNVLEQLPSRQQEVIYLRFFHNLMPEEIGAILSINPQSVSNIIQRALTNLRGLWQSFPSFTMLFYSFSQIFY